MPAISVKVFSIGSFLLYFRQEKGVLRFPYVFIAKKPRVNVGLFGVRNFVAHVTQGSFPPHVLVYYSCGGSRSALGRNY